jgi:hypothetical protein
MRLPEAAPVQSFGRTPISIATSSKGWATAILSPLQIGRAHV